MPTKCSILYCGATLSRNRANLTFHRLPQSKHKKRIWLEVIGKNNLRTDLKNIYICSFHFDEKSFNRTLNVIRLKDDAVPSLFVQQPSTLHQSAPTARDDNVDAATSINLELQPSILHQSASVVTDHNYIAASQQDIELDQTLKELKRLQEKVRNQRRKIKCLNETVRRQRIKIAAFKNYVNELKENNHNS